MSSLRDEEKRALLDIARKAISLHVSEGRYLQLSPIWGALSQAAGAFVTLETRGRLRGCIGRLEAFEPLANVVAQCAVAAATEDPRFSPLAIHEIAELAIEISVLSPLEPTSPEHVEVGKHGLVITWQERRGVLLPQVPVEHRWTRVRFLEETCRKAGLPQDSWRDRETQIAIFTAQVFSDADFGQEGSAIPR